MAVSQGYQSQGTEPITPSSIGRDQKPLEDKFNSQVWYQGTPGQAHQAELVIIQTGNNTPQKRSSGRTTASNK